VIDEAFGASCITYSALIALGGIDAAIESLRLREGMPSTMGVGFVDLHFGRYSDTASQRHPQAIGTIKAWARSNGYHAAIWTALASNFHERDKAGPFR
jgi:hypothetical protein